MIHSGVSFGVVPERPRRPLTLPRRRKAWKHGLSKGTTLPKRRILRGKGGWSALAPRDTFTVSPYHTRWRVCPAFDPISMNQYDDDKRWLLYRSTADPRSRKLGSLVSIRSPRTHLKIWRKSTYLLFKDLRIHRCPERFARNPTVPFSEGIQGSGEKNTRASEISEFRDGKIRTGSPYSVSGYLFPSLIYSERSILRFDFITVVNWKEWSVLRLALLLSSLWRERISDFTFTIV